MKGFRSAGAGVPPLAAASSRLRRPPGRPRLASSPLSPPASQAGALSQAAENAGPIRVTVPTLCPVTPRLLDVAGAAEYLSVSEWTIRDLDAAGYLPRVRLPLPGGKELRRLLYDRADLDRLVDRSKER